MTGDRRTIDYRIDYRLSLGNRDKNKPGPKIRGQEPSAPEMIEPKREDGD